ncbi:MAG TPA: hypothetical protein VIU33_03470 [Nitrospiria bacterium]
MLDRLKNLVLDNFMIKVISVFFAVLLWLFVSSKSGDEGKDKIQHQDKTSEALVLING